MYTHTDWSDHMELLSPAGDFAALVAAVQNGADAVYFGARGFNARRSADNFGGDGLASAVRYCHERGVKVYITLNTMVRQDEFDKLDETVREIALAGADAVIVQDLGVARAVRRIAPHMALHASTQMAVHNLAGVKLLQKMGFARVVLAREMDFEEIRACADTGVDVEVFGHGALCVSCSGQCLMSSLIGGRSGNRGMCAQPCRMKYRLDGKEGYYLSPRDLMTADIIHRMLDAGVTSLKIEGRLKRPEYVAVVTGIYRRALDGETITEKDTDALRQIFSRGGFTHGYGPGAEESTLMYHERPNHAGILAGRVDKNGFVTLLCDVDENDLIMLQGAGDDIPVKLSGKKGQRIPCKKALHGMLLCRLVSDAQMTAARKTWQDEHRAQHLQASLSVHVGHAAVLSVWNGAALVQVTGAVVQQAQSKPFDENRTRAQLQKTGGTAYVLSDIAIDADHDAFLPVSELNNLRRDALDAFSRENTKAVQALHELGDISLSAPPASGTQLRVQSGNVEALKNALRAGADSVCFSPFDMRRLDDALALPAFYLALPQVMRQEELENIHRWALAHSDRILGVYLSNIAHFAYAWPGERIADAGMNMANNLSVRELNADLYTPSVELTARQISQLGGKKDLIVHGYLPLMQLRHCPNRAVKGLKGKHAACRLCDQKDAPPLPAFEDRTGAKFQLRRIAYDSGCVLQLLNSVPLMLLRRADKLPRASVWRMLIDSPGEAEYVKLYRACLDGQDYTRLPQWETLSHIPSTTGHYFRGVE